MEENFRLEVTTPERMVLREQVGEAQIPAANGYLGVLPGHAPLLAILKPGELSYRQGGHTYKLAVGPGFVEVLPNQTKVLVETAEKKEEIDVARAQKALSRAEERLHHPDPDCDIERARASLERAAARINVAGR